MAGVRLATGYIEISAETSKVPKQIQDALNQAGGDAAKKAGQQIGKDVATGVNQGMQSAPAPSGGGGVLSDVIAGKPISGNAREQGRKVGKEVATGINEGMSQGAAAPKIDEAITKSSNPRETGRKIGKEVQDGINESVSEAGGAGTQIGESINQSLDKIDVGGKLSGKLKTSLESALPTISVIGDLLGKDLTTPLQEASDAINKIGAKDSTTKLTGIADGLNTLTKSAKNLTGIDISGVTGELAGLASLGATLGPLLDALKGIPIWAGLAQSTLLKFAPLAFVGSQPDVKKPEELGKIPDTRFTAGMNEDQKRRFWEAMDRGDRAEAKRIKDEAAGIKPPPPPTPKGIGLGGGPGGYDWDPQGPSATPGGFFGVPQGLKPPAPIRGGWEMPRTPSWSRELPPPPGSVGIGGGRGGYDWDPQGYGPPVRAATPSVISPPVPAGTATAGTVDIHATSAAVSIGSASISAGSIAVAGASFGSGYAGPSRAAAIPSLGGWGRQSGGDIPGAGAVPIIAHGGEHMLTTSDVAAMGGHDGVYAFRNALHYDNGGKIIPLANVTGEGTPGDAASGSGKPVLPQWWLDGGKKAVWFPDYIPGQSGWLPPPFWRGPSIEPGMDPKGNKLPGYDKGGKVVGDTPQWLKDAAGRAGMSPEQYAASLAHLPADAPGEHQSIAQKGIMDQAVGGDEGKNVTDMIDAARTAGFISTGAGSKAVAGTSFVAGLLNLGNEAVAGLIDTGASAAQTALSLAASAGSFGAPGAGAAASSLGGIGIQIAAGEGKRAASYGFQMASILADSVIDQVFGPFGGPPRWLGYDYSQFVPHFNIGAIGTTTAEKAVQAAMGTGKKGQGPGEPVNPQLMGGQQPVGAPVPKFGTMAPPQPLGAEPAPGGPGGPPGAVPGGQGAPPPAPPPAEAPGSGPQGGGAISDLLKNVPGFSIHDEGGWLMPGQPGLNTTGRPELVLSPQQLDAAMTGANGNPYGRGGDTYHITAVNAEDVAREIDKRKRLAILQYSGRP